MNTLRKPTSWIIAFWLYFAILLAISIAAYLKILPTQLTVNDKLGHFILLGLAGFLSHQALGRRTISILAIALPLGPLLASFFSLIDECLQLFSSNRTFDLTDLSANWLGIWIFYGIAETIRRQKLERQKHLYKRTNS